jgi:hypothetical protein
MIQEEMLEITRQSGLINEYIMRISNTRKSRVNLVLSTVMIHYNYNPHTYEILTIYF